MTDETMKMLASNLNALSEAWKCSLVTAGLNAGLFDDLNINTPVTIERIAEKYHYDPAKLEKWMYYCLNAGLLQRADGGYIITEKCSQFMADSPFKDLVGFMRINDYFMRAALESQQLFKPNNSLDKLTEGRISRDYQPKVSDNLSASLIEIFKRYNMGDDQTLLDIGCGNGAFLRTLAGIFPGMKISGLDSNLFAIEWGKKKNQEAGFGDRIKMLVGDARHDMGDFEDNSVDWVMAINLFHFFPVEGRLPLIEQMIRVAKKGVFFTEVMVERSMLSAAADPLMALLWNDFTGFFREADAEEINRKIERKYAECVMEKNMILQGSSYLIAVAKKS